MNCLVWSSRKSAYLLRAVQVIGEVHCILELTPSDGSQLCWEEQIIPVTQGFAVQRGFVPAKKETVVSS